MPGGNVLVARSLLHGKQPSPSKPPRYANRRSPLRPVAKSDPQERPQRRPHPCPPGCGCICNSGQSRGVGPHETPRRRGPRASWKDTRTPRSAPSLRGAQRRSHPEAPGWPRALTRPRDHAAKARDGAASRLHAPGRPRRRQLIPRAEVRLSRLARAPGLMMRPARPRRGRRHRGRYRGAGARSVNTAVPAASLAWLLLEQAVPAAPPAANGKIAPSFSCHY
jgi:hypothetical protein